MKGIISRFRHFIAEQALVTEGDKVLLAVSGGLDSVVMAHLFQRAGLDFAIAHCNFNLRGEESDGDEAFVRELAKQLGVEIFVRHFDTRAAVASGGQSIQMAARELRYAWFAELGLEHGFAKVATAHHKDDVAETILLNLVKGAVIEGLLGIQPIHGNIIRPLLWAGREELRAYAADNGITHREDSSNLENKYQRNMLRNEVIPLLRKINPSLPDTLYQASLARTGLARRLYADIEKLAKQIKKQEKGRLIIPIADLKQYAVNAPVLFAMLESYGFSFTQVQNLFTALSIPDAKTFTSTTHQMVKERENIIVMPLESYEKEGKSWMVTDGPNKIQLTDDSFLRTEVMPISGWIMERKENIAQLDHDKLHFPLMLRMWQPGDAFVPLGMKGRKKISDFLTDARAEHLQKEAQLVLLSGDDIVWLVGRRIDERYKVTPHTRHVYRMVLEGFEAEAAYWK